MDRHHDASRVLIIHDLRNVFLAEKQPPLVYQVVLRAPNVLRPWLRPWLPPFGRVDSTASGTPGHLFSLFFMARIPLIQDLES